MLKWAYNPQLRAKSVPVTGKVSEHLDIELNVVKEAPDAPSRYLTERKGTKKKVSKKSLTVNFTATATAGRRNSFSLVKQGLKAIKLKKNLSNSTLNINEADDDDEGGEDEEILKEPEEETKKATITDIAKCHFSRVFEPDSGG